MITVKHFLYQQYNDIDTLDKHYFIAKVLNISIGQVLHACDTVLTPAQYKLLCTYCHRRKNTEPVDNIIGTKGFWDGEFFVSPAVLSPRPDTETLLTCVQQVCTTPPTHILDMGTGSGCILISLLRLYKNAVGMAVDICNDALALAKKNAVHNGVHKRITYVKSDWWQSIETPKPFDIIVSNPPYIPTADIATLPPEVQKFDPLVALDGGEDGLNPYGILAQMPHTMLGANGYMVVECGYGQHGAVAQIFTDNNWTLHHQQTDLSHIIRTQVFQKI